MRLFRCPQLTKLLVKQHQLVGLQLLWTADVNLERQLYEVHVTREEVKWLALQ